MTDKDNVGAMPEVSSASGGIGVSSLYSTSAADKNIPELLPQQTSTDADSRPNVLHNNDKFGDKSAVDDADDIVESSSPLRRDMDDDDDGLLSTSYVVPMTDTAAYHHPIPPALASLPSLVQLSNQALKSHTVGTVDELTSSISCSAGPLTADMFSEDEELTDGSAEMTEVV